MKIDDLLNIDIVSEEVGISHYALPVMPDTRCPKAEYPPIRIQ